MIKILFLLLALGGCSNEICNYKNVSALSNKIVFNLEVSCSDQDREKGLMYRDLLESNNGMIFVFPKENLYSFWMKNTNIPLSIAFLNSNNLIVDIKDMKANDLTPVSTSVEAMYAIGMNLGWFKENHISIGDKVVINH